MSLRVRFLAVIALTYLAAVADFALARVLLVSHFESSLDADHSLHGEAKADAKGFSLSDVGLGQSFSVDKQSTALNAAYSGQPPQDARLRYPAANLDSRRGSLEMWVKPNYSADADQSHKNDTFRTLWSAPLGEGGSVSMYYAFYRWNGYQPNMVLHFNAAGQEQIAAFRLSADDKGWGQRWAKDEWRHLLVTWTPTKLRMFLDGKLVNEKLLETPLDMPPISGPIVIGNDIAGGRLAHALIDEVRICDAPQFEDVKQFPLPSAPPSADEDATLIGAGGFATLRAPDVRQYDCYAVPVPPQVDGRLDDAAWQKLPAMSGFLNYSTVDEYAIAQTEVRICRDSQTIYLGILAHERELDRLKAKIEPQPEPQDDAGVTNDDSLEVFLAPLHGKYPNVQIGVNSQNARFDQRHRPDRIDKSWNGAYQTAVGKTDDGWVLEMAFPAKEVESELRIGDVWGFRVARTRTVNGLVQSACNYASHSFQNPPQFARLVMTGNAPTLEVAREEARLNRDFLAASVERFRRFAADAAIQLAIADQAPEKVRQLLGIADLADPIRKSLHEVRELLSEAAAVSVARWNRVGLNLEASRAKLDRFDFLLANAGGPQAEMPDPEFLGVAKKGPFFYLAAKQLAVAVEPNHGMVAGIWDRASGTRLAANSFFVYDVQTRTTEARADERADVVTKASVQENRLTLECHNPALPGVVLRKHYYLETAGDEQRLLCRKLEIGGAAAELTLVRITSRTLFDEQFRTASSYHRIFTIGTMGDQRNTVPATEVNSSAIQRAWYNSEEGRAHFAMIHPELKLGLGEYLYKEREQWAFPQALPSSYWTPYGWEMGFAATFVGDGEYSAELRYHLVHGDRFTFHREYMALPEYAAARAEGAALGKVMKLAGHAGVQVNQVIGDTPHINKYREGIAGPEVSKLWRPDEWMLTAYATTDRRWPDYPTGDDQAILEPHIANLGVINARYNAGDVRRSIARLKEMNPRLLAQSYDFVFDIYKESETIRQHPEWVRKDRNGQPHDSAYYGAAYATANWCPEFVEHLIAGLLRSCDYYGLDICYIDFGVGATFADWGRGHVVSMAEQVDFVRRLQAELHQRGKLLWLNANTGQPYFDVGFFEGLGCVKWGTGWRDHAETHLLVKLFEPEGAAIVPLYWFGGDVAKTQQAHNETKYIDMTLGSGLMPAGCMYDPYHQHFPAADGGADWSAIAKYQIAVHHAALEMRGATVAEGILLKPWWDDPKSSLEAYPLRLRGNPGQPTYLVNLISHADSKSEIVIDVDLAAMKLDPRKRTFIWQLLRRDYEAYPKQVPPPANWNELFSARQCETRIPGRERLSYTVPALAPNRLCVSAVTQTPAYIASAAGIATQLPLPSALGCELTGTVDEQHRSVRLTAVADKVIEAMVWFPGEWGTPIVDANGQTLACERVEVAGQQFVRVPLSVGKHEILVRAK